MDTEQLHMTSQKPADLNLQCFEDRFHPGSAW